MAGTFDDHESTARSRRRPQRRVRRPQVSSARAFRRELSEYRPRGFVEILEDRRRAQLHFRPQ